eukprot:CAMPEP_0177662632 /NCGR_PEP_ID=MMETSP0447-20121125/19419_1 /TAXON_ID=0 /ORGANISM="Stygamoeba regulata, Strain BSH-02190019" /LENGTH=727 /DNA_ID=CAMNT_0019168261 /DNA_START=104 /DNA_END=2289 /DNA_ORIENTATION=+
MTSKFNPSTTFGGLPTLQEDPFVLKHADSEEKAHATSTSELTDRPVSRLTLRHAATNLDSLPVMSVTSHNENSVSENTTPRVEFNSSSIATRMIPSHNLGGSRLHVSNTFQGMPSPYQGKTKLKWLLGAMDDTSPTSGSISMRLAGNSKLANRFLDNEEKCMLLNDPGKLEKRDSSEKKDKLMLLKTKILRHKPSDPLIAFHNDLANQSLKETKAKLLEDKRKLDQLIAPTVKKGGLLDKLFHQEKKKPSQDIMADEAARLLRRDSKVLEAQAEEEAAQGGQGGGAVPLQDEHEPGAARVLNKGQQNLFNKLTREDIHLSTTQSLVWVTSSEKKKLCIIFNRIQDLPPDVQESVARMKIDMQLLENNLDILANVLSFCDKRKPKRLFLTGNMARNIEEHISSHGKHQPRMLLSEADAFDRQLRHKELDKNTQLKSCLGGGGYGQVFVATFDKDFMPALQDKEVAVKILSHKTTREKKNNLHEISFQRFCTGHANFCELHSVFLVGADEVWLVQERLDGGTLKEVASSKLQHHFTEEHIAYVAREVLRGISFLHDNNIAHRDIKNTNIMFDFSGHIKLIDYGLCADMSLGPRKQMCGSPFWMAPEMIRGEHHTLAVDIWSFAVCLVELANGSPPHFPYSKRAMFHNAVLGMGERYGLHQDELYTAQFKHFLSRCLVMEPSKRLKPADLLLHPFLQTACAKGEMEHKIDLCLRTKEFTSAVVSIATNFY